MRGMKENLRSFAVADVLSCRRLFGGESPLVLKCTVCHVVVADFVAKRSAVKLPEWVEILGSDIMQMDKLCDLRKRFAPMLTIDDVALLHAARKEDVILITDDGAVRRCANELGIETIGSQVFAAQVARLETDDAPPLALTDYRMKKITNIDTDCINQNRNRILKNNSHE